VQTRETEQHNVAGININDRPMNVYEQRSNE